MRTTLEDGARAYVLSSHEEVFRPSLGDALDCPLTREEASYFLARLLRSPANSAMLRRFLGSTTPSLAHREDHELLRDLAHLWRAGRVGVQRCRAPALTGLDGDGEEEAIVPFVFVEREEPRPEKTWIEIELLDEKGKPVAGERYRLKLTDGNTYQGRLDTWGQARYPQIDAGVCAVWFPDLDGKRWGIEKRAGEEEDDPGGEGSGSQRSWVEIELLNDDDTPAANETYEITLPNGDVFRGKLDEYGTAFHGDIDPGTCSITFPGLTAREWEGEA